MRHDLVSSPPQSQNLDLDQINASTIEHVSDSADQRTELERKSLEIEHLRASLSGLTQDITERKKYAHRIFCLISVWLALIFVLLLFDGFGRWVGFSVPSPIVLAVIGSTTLNVLGLFYLVAHYLFPKKNA